jgi:hypothetical protein
VPRCRFQNFSSRPGINREINQRTSNEGGWRDGDKIRFRFGFPEKIGGWVKKSSNSFLGACRALHPWVTLSGNRLIGVGTSSKVLRRARRRVLTTSRRCGLTTAAGDVTFAAATGSATLTVTDVRRTARWPGTFVTFSGATSLGRHVITADVLNQEYQIVDVSSTTTTYTIDCARGLHVRCHAITDGRRRLVPTPVAANASDTSDGGAFCRRGVSGHHRVSATAVCGHRLGRRHVGPRHVGQRRVNSTCDHGRRCGFGSHDNFGEDLLIFNRAATADIYYWDSLRRLGARGRGA